MFVAVELEDKVRVPPDRLKGDEVASVTYEIHAKFCNKVIHNVGLCLVLLDIVKIGDAIVYPGCGSAHFETRFRVLVFRPFVGEVLCGTISNTNAEGIRISLGFFDDIFVPRRCLKAPREFREGDDQLYVWRFQGSELFYDEHAVVRFRVSDVQFNSIGSAADAAVLGKAGDAPKKGVLNPGGVTETATSIVPIATPTIITSVVASGPEIAAAAVSVDDDKKKIGPLPPLVVLASMAEDGLGCLEWW
eukprot:TRINITY_DN15664_c0_g1_i1.p1 TRINITY_DN15664_c0_g1~~TRINITY_DN15664_c0_g1_i1.p1  ORF type:complete len:247 (-),score=59.16 TRINITY_DN15664_c0_g1_i1:222-962(-)